MGVVGPSNSGTKPYCNRLKVRRNMEDKLNALNRIQNSGSTITREAGCLDSTFRVQRAMGQLLYLRLVPGSQWLSGGLLGCLGSIPHLQFVRI